MRFPYGASIEPGKSSVPTYSVQYGGVAIEFHNLGLHIQLTPNEAIEMAANLLAAADKHGQRTQSAVKAVAKRIAKKYVKGLK